MLKSSLATLVLLLCSETLAADVPTTITPPVAPAVPAVGGRQPLRFHNCDIDDDGSGAGKEAILRGLLQSAVNTAGTAHRGIRSMAATPGDIEVNEKVRKAYENWFMPIPTHIGMVRDMFQNYAPVLTNADMTLHVYCHPYTYRDVRVPDADTDEQLLAWNQADTGEDDPNVPEVTAADEPEEFAVNQKEMRDRIAVGCGNSYAYVPGGTNRMYLCPRFWTLPAGSLPAESEEITRICNTDFGTNPRQNVERTLDNKYMAFTLIHELSHTFKVGLGTGVTDTDDQDTKVPGTNDDISTGPNKSISGYTFAQCRKKAIREQAYRNADSYAFAAFDIWKQINCSGPGKRRRGKDTQLDCPTDSKRPAVGAGVTTKIRRAVSPEQLKSVCAQACEKGYKEMIKPVFPMSGKGASKKASVCVSIAAVPCKKGQGIKFVEHRDTSGEGWPLIKEVCDANTKPDDKDKDPQQAEADKKQQELAAKKKELEDKKAANAAEQEKVKETVREKTKDKAPLPLPTNKDEGSDKKCPKGLAGLACRAANAAT